MGLDPGFRSGVKVAVVDRTGKEVATDTIYVAAATGGVWKSTDKGANFTAIWPVTNPQSMGALVITHYPRILAYIKPDFVHVFSDGRIVAEGGSELAQKLEAEGYEAFVPEAVA